MKPLLITLCALILALVFAIGYMTGKGIEVKERAYSDYQLNVDTTGGDILDGSRYVGRLDYGRNNQLDSLIDYDNQ